MIRNHSVGKIQRLLGLSGFTLLCLLSICKLSRLNVMQGGGIARSRAMTGLTLTHDAPPLYAQSPLAVSPLALPAT